jgi:acetyltransferase-like isoleucine patch superfamily enzyme
MRVCFKRFLLFFSLVLASPFIFVSRISFRFRRQGLFRTCGTMLSLAPGKFGSYIRLGFYKATLKGMSSDVSIGFGSFFSQRTAEVGKNVSIGAYCIIGNVILHDGVMIASRVSIISGKHQHGSFLNRGDVAGEPVFDKVTIGRNVWIGEGAIVAADLGDDTVVSVGSVVTRPMPSNSLIVGNPARPIMKNNKKEDVEKPAAERE